MPTGASSDEVVPPAQVDGGVADHRHALVRDAVVGEVGHLRRHHDQPGARQLARERDHAPLVHPLVVDAVRDDQPAPARLAAQPVDARAKRPARAVDGQVLLDQRVAGRPRPRRRRRARTTARSASCRRASSGGRATIPARRRRPTRPPSLTSSRLRIGAEICHASRDAQRDRTRKDEVLRFGDSPALQHAPGSRVASTCGNPPPRPRSGPGPAIGHDELQARAGEALRRGPLAE